MALHGQELGNAYERSAVLTKWYPAKGIPNDEQLYGDAVEFAGYLKVIYDAETGIKRDDLMTAPTNLIIYGPTGTGKTYSTIQEAVKLCDGTVPEGSAGVVKTRFDALMKAKRIEFVTFHQSYSYEDFVMGLRPETAEGGSIGFSLVPTPRIFYRIAEAARANRGPIPSSEMPKLNREGLSSKCHLVTP